MKKIAKMVLVLAAIIAVTVPFGAFAQDILFSKVEGCVSGNNYALLVVKRGTSVSGIGEDNLLFIDQYTASGSVMEIAVIYPMQNACDVYVGGEFTDSVVSPRLIGSYTASHLPQQLQTIEKEAFEGASFTHVFLGGYVESIQSAAFRNCASLSYIYIPSSVTEIADDAFDGCANVTIGCEQGSAAYQYAVGHGLNTKVVD